LRQRADSTSLTRSMPSFRLLLSLAGVVLLACRSDSRDSQPPPPDFAKAFSYLPLPPNPEVVSRANSADALQLTLHSPAGPEEVTSYYAEHDGPPLWVRIWKLGDRGTMVELTGAVVAKDTTKAKPAAPKAAPKPASDG